MLRGRALMGLCLLSMLGASGMAALGTQTVPGALSMQATIECVGVVAPYAGDDNRNNAATIWYRPLSVAAWQAGPEMMVDRTARQWRASLVYLSPGTEYEVQVRFTDPDGVTPAVVGGPIQTRPDYPDVGDGGHILIVPGDGDLQTVARAASPGDTIRLRSGVYHTTATLRAEDSGAAGHYVTIEPVPGEHVVLDGSDVEINDRLVDNWHQYQGSIYYADLAWGDRACDPDGNYTMPNYVGERRGTDGVRYLLYNDGSEEWDDFLAGPPGKAYYDCDGAHIGRLYVTTYEGDDPDLHEMHVARYKTGLFLAGADYVRIRNLEFRYYGWYGIHLGAPGADHNIVEGNTFHGSKYHVFVGTWTSDPANAVSADNLVQDNHFYEQGYRDSRWTWREHYGHARSVAVVVVYAKGGNVIRRNTLKGGQDGIAVGWQSHNTDVYENVIEEYMDDGIEVDSQPGYNIRVWENTIRHCFSSISNQDWFIGDYWNAGPVYVFRNVIDGGSDPLGRTDLNGGIEGYFSNYAFKVGTDMDGPGRVYYYHNTVYIPDSPVGGNGVQDAGGGYFSGLVARNNLWAVRGRVFYMHLPTAIVRHDLDCDNLQNAGTPTDTRFILWSRSGGPEGNGVYRNLSTFQAYTGQELHGISDNSTSFKPDFSLRAGSPEIDAGCVIAGFNDHGPWAYRGPKPDIGAFEYARRPDLSASTKRPALGAVSTGDRVTYTIRVVNTGAPLTSTVIVTDVLPAGLDYLDGTVTATLGSAWVTSGGGLLIHWRGVMSDTPAVEIRYGVRVEASGTLALQNVAWIGSGVTEVISRSATIIVNGKSCYLPVVVRSQ